MNSREFQIADLSVAAFGRKEIQLAEHEMPGLMAVRAEFAPSKPLRGSQDHRVAAHAILESTAHQRPAGMSVPSGPSGNSYACGCG